MNWIQLLGAIVAIGLLVYLVAALIDAENL
jgi:K+-transporting ATPase KdpF subunit